jgi:hypothetical protein
MVKDKIGSKTPNTKIGQPAGRRAGAVCILKTVCATGGVVAGSCNKRLTGVSGNDCSVGVAEAFSSNIAAKSFQRSGQSKIRLKAAQASRTALNGEAGQRKRRAS